MQEITIDATLQALIPPMGEEERAMLEQNVLEHGCRDPLVTWRGVLLDGHNRYAICQKHGIEFRTIEMEFDSIEQARVWMRNNQLGRRNLTPAWRLELQLANKDDLAKIGAVKRVESKIGNKNAAADKTSLSQIDNDEPTESKHNTQAAIAKAAGTSTGMVGMAEVVRKKAPDLWEKAKAGDTTVSAAYNKIKKQDEISQRHEAITAQTVEESKSTPSLIWHRDAIEWLAEIEPVDLLLTDPPYSTDVEDIAAFAQSWLPLALSKVKPTGRAFVFVGAYPGELQAYLNVALPEQVLVWTYRNTLGPSPKFGYKLNWQAILYYQMPDAAPLDCPVMLEQLSVQDISAPDGRLGDRYHAWQKPMEIGERFIRHATRQGDTVADPFACTGTFLLAASKLGRHGIGCDISAEHIDIAVERGCQRG